MPRREGVEAPIWPVWRGQATSPLFEQASVETTHGKLDLALPLIARTGVEVQPTENLTLELAGTYTHGARDPAFRLRGEAYFRNVTGIGDYIGSIDLSRRLTDSYSVRLGAEYAIPRARMTVRGGASYESSAVEKRQLSPLLVDSDKALLGFGLGVRLVHTLHLDLLVGHVFFRSQKVTDSAVAMGGSLRPMGPTQPSEPIANGRYALQSTFAGIGLSFHL